MLSVSTGGLATAAAFATIAAGGGLATFGAYEMTESITGYNGLRNSFAYMGYEQGYYDSMTLLTMGSMAGMQYSAEYAYIHTPAPATASVYLTGDDALLHTNASNMKPALGYTDVVMHGSPTEVGLYRNGQWVSMNQRSLANYLKHTPDYSGGPIRLVSCDAGALSNGLAQNLSNKMGVSVMAPTQSVIIWSDGYYQIGHQIGLNTYTNSGSWRVFYPGGGY